MIGWEADKVLEHAKETRLLFDGHPRSSEPSAIKVLAMLDDCIRYVWPSRIRRRWWTSTTTWLRCSRPTDRSECDRAYHRPARGLREGADPPVVRRLRPRERTDGSAVKFELVGPILWKSLEKDLKVQVVRRGDKEITKGRPVRTKEAFHFIRVVKASPYLTPTAKSYCSNRWW